MRSQPALTHSQSPENSIAVPTKMALGRYMPIFMNISGRTRRKKKNEAWRRSRRLFIVLRDDSRILPIAKNPCGPVAGTAKTVTASMRNLESG